MITTLEISWQHHEVYKIKVKGELTPEQISAIGDAVADVTHEKYGDLETIIEGLGVEIVSADGRIVRSGYSLDDYEEGVTTNGPSQA